MSLRSTPDFHPTEGEIKRLADELGINLAEIFRPQRAYALFGLKHTQVAEKIRSGEIERPIPLSESGTAVRWTGRQMVIHHYRRLVAAKRKKIAA
jgi:hypothetical protein